MARLLLLVLVVPVLSVILYYCTSTTAPSMPDLDLDEWWGPNHPRTRQDKSISPFQVKFSEGLINDLKSRLKDHRPFAPALEGVAFQYGFHSKQLNDWIQYWMEEYPFSEREKFLNQYPQFVTNIQGLDIHFIRVKPQVSAGVELVPILMIHGWPGSVREFYEAIPLLTAVSKDRDFAIELIMPSLPGYGFSDAAVRPGLGVDKVAVIFRNLMHRLGFKKFYVQGGDWGALVSSVMATVFPKEVLGYHTNMPIMMTTSTTIFRILGALYPPLVVQPEFADRIYPLTEKFAKLLEETGYLHIQATKPDTVGIGLSDSPAGLAAYILEKFSTWTNFNYKNLPDGGFTRRFTKDQLLDNVMIYWASNSITTSMRLYSESLSKRFRALRIEEIPTAVPTWVIQARYELGYVPPWMLKSKYPNLVNETVLEEGGHFLAFEMPKTFAQDVLTAINNFRKWHKVHEITEL